ncbi:MAG: nucleotidyltransferase domain-containing protein [Candidatus Omnitrophica bacterium]|nr:nucleotidyltransferase domain-containing protein [Candidatus Omnitrophota bacterium]MBU1523923.1 nucleotidyltransferase domain-containing protein [Candidatus Omnitrophota bacterium]MBU2437208.1 nucleotidyltransferase domain-containing protein [Candidatus Omnitrophota bacterium]
MNAREEEIVNGVIEILRRYLDVTCVILFGSRAKGNNGHGADFDFAVNREKPQISLQRQINEEIEKISGLYKVDIVYLLSVSKEFKDIILETGKVVYEKRA